MDSKPHWHVLGAGAIGTVMATALHTAGHSVTLVLRDNSALGEKAAGTPASTGSANLTLTATDGSERRFSFPVTSPEHLKNQTPSVSHLLVTTKSYDVCNAVDAIAHALQPSCNLLILTNGMGMAEKIQSKHPELAIYCGTTTEGAYRTSTGNIVHAGRGETRIGGLASTGAPPWFTHWETALEKTHWDTNIKAALWAKLAINCVINPLTALHGCDNGELAQRRDLIDEVNQLCAEIRQVSYAAGFTETAQTLQETVAAVITGTAKNKSSMLQDITLGRKTEIADITGFFLQQARRYGIPTPYNEQIMKRITTL